MGLRPTRLMPCAGGTRACADKVDRVDPQGDAPLSARVADGESYSGGCPRFKRPALQETRGGVAGGAADGLLVAEGFDRIEPGGFDRRIHAEKEADRRREAQPDGERPPGQRDRESREQVNGPADATAEQDAEHAA